MAERIALDIALRGAEEVLAELRSIDKFANILDRKTIKLKADTSINNLKRNIDDINRAMLNLDHMYDALKADAKEWHEIAEDASEDERKQIAEEVKAIRERMRANREEYREKQLQKRSLQNTNRELTNEVKANELRMDLDVDTTKADMKLGSIYNKWSGFASRIGSSMITLGNTLQTITSPFDSIMRGAMYGIGYGALNKVTEGLSSSTSRYDTLKTYPKIMEQLGFSSTKAEKSVNKLNDSVIGLPTGLDEIVDMAKKYALATGDIEKGTDVAIAANNAFLASAATDSQKYQGMMQLNDVLAGKKLQSREWMSLAASMPAAMQEIGRYLGYTKNSEFLQALYGNKVGNDKFIKALRAVGTETGKVAEMAEISKTTFAGLASNIKNAFSRGGYKLLDALDNILIKATGKSTVENFKKITDGIDSVFEMGEKWINAHPEAIMEFFDYLRNFDWKGLVVGFASAAKNVLGVLRGFFDLISGGNMSNVGKFMVYGNIIGKVLTVFGGAIKGLAPVFGAAGVLGTLAKGGTIGGLLGKVLMPFAKIGEMKKAIQGAEAMGEVGEAASKIPITWQSVANKATMIAAIPAVAGAMLMAAKALQEFDKVKLSWGLVGKIGVGMAAIAAFIGEAAVIGGALASNPIGWITTASAAIGGGAMAAAAGEMVLVGKALNSFANAKIPDTTKVTEVVGAVAEIASELSKVELPDMGENAGENANTMSDILSSAVSMLSSSKQIAELKVTEKQLEEAEKAIGNMKPHMDKIKKTIAELYGNETVTTTPRQTGKAHAKGRTSVKRQVYDSDSLTAAYEDTGKVSGIVGYVQSFIENMKTFKDKIDEFEGLDMKGATKKLNKNIHKMAKVADEIKKYTSSFEGIEDAGTQFESIFNAVKAMKKVIAKVQEIKNMGDVKVSSTLKGVISDISKGLSGIGDAQQKATQFASFAKSIKSGVTKLQEINDVEIKLDGFEASVKTVVKKLKDATSKIKGAWHGLKKVTNKIKDITRNVTVTVNISGVDAAVQKMNSDAARLSAAYAALKSAMNNANSSGGGSVTTPRLSGRKGVYGSTGGYIDGRGRILYRSQGGGVPVFKPRGIDTVPAMLAPGEYVQNRKAVKHFGVEFMQRLNHLDLEGALRSISTRAASGLGGGNVIHITNDNRQNNAKVNQTIYTNNPNYTFRRANRFVEAL